MYTMQLGSMKGSWMGTMSTFPDLKAALVTRRPKWFTLTFPIVCQVAAGTARETRLCDEQEEQRVLPWRHLFTRIFHLIIFFHGMSIWSLQFLQFP